MYSCLQKAALAVLESTAESTVFLPAKGCARSSPRVCMRRTIHALRLRPRARRTRSLHRKVQPTLDSTFLPSSEKLGLLSSSSSESEIHVRARIFRAPTKNCYTHVPETSEEQDTSLSIAPAQVHVATASFTQNEVAHIAFEESKKLHLVIYVHLLKHYA
jgi:hypothetical protein